MRQNYQVLIGHAKVQQEHLVDSMRHREKLMMVIIEEAPHLMAKTQDVKRKTSGRATRGANAISWVSMHATHSSAKTDQNSAK